MTLRSIRGWDARKYPRRALIVMPSVKWIIGTIALSGVRRELECEPVKAIGASLNDGTCWLVKVSALVAPELDRESRDRVKCVAGQAV